jgi:hypothetical protein
LLATATAAALTGDRRHALAKAGIVMLTSHKVFPGSARSNNGLGGPRGKLRWPACGADDPLALKDDLILPLTRRKAAPYLWPQRCNLASVPCPLAFREIVST